MTGINKNAEVLYAVVDQIQTLTEAIFNVLCEAEVINEALARMESGSLKSSNVFSNLISVGSSDISNSSSMYIMEATVVSHDGISSLFELLTSTYDTEPEVQLFSLRCLLLLVLVPSCVSKIASLAPKFARTLFLRLASLGNGNHIDKLLEERNGSTRRSLEIERQAAATVLQLLGHLVLVPAAIDGLARGMDPAAFFHTLEMLMVGYKYADKKRKGTKDELLYPPKTMDLLLCMYSTPLRRHTKATIDFAKNILKTRVINILLDILRMNISPSREIEVFPGKPQHSDLAEYSRRKWSGTEDDEEEVRITRECVGGLLRILLENPGSGKAIISTLNENSEWSNWSYAQAGTPDDVRALLMPAEMVRKAALYDNLLEMEESDEPSSISV